MGATVVVTTGGTTASESSESSLPDVAQKIKPITRPMMSRAATTVIAKRASRGSLAPKGNRLLGEEIPPGETGVLPVVCPPVLLAVLPVAPPVVLGGTDQAGDVGGWPPDEPPVLSVGGLPPVGGQSVIEPV